MAAYVFYQSYDKFPHKSLNNMNQLIFSQPIKKQRSDKGLWHNRQFVCPANKENTKSYKLSSWWACEMENCDLVLKQLKLIVKQFLNITTNLDSQRAAE